MSEADSEEVSTSIASASIHCPSASPSVASSSSAAPASPTASSSPSTPSSIPSSPHSSPTISLPSTPSQSSAPSSPVSLSSLPPTAPLRSCLLRLDSDFKQLEADPPEGIDASPLHPSDPLTWRACLFGPCDSEWEGAVLPLQLRFPFDYPLKPPRVRFTSRVYHPNVFSDGGLCLDILQDKWSPVYSVASLLQSVQSLLTDPNTASPANPEAAKLWQSDKKEYRRRVRQCVAAEAAKAASAH